MPTIEGPHQALLDHMIQDRPLIYQQPGWEERVRKFGKGVVDGTQFISKLRAGITPKVLSGLAQHDHESTLEAYETGQLADYEADSPDEFGISDNSCLWRSKKAAVAATHRPRHMAGSLYMVRHDVYEDFIIRKYDGVPDDDLGLRLTLVRTITKAHVLRHMKTGDKNA